MMKTSHKLKNAFHQLRPSTSHVPSSVTGRTRLFPQIAPARQAPNSLTPKPSNITPLIEKRRNRAESFWVPKSIYRLLSTDTTTPGSFSSSQNPQSNDDSAPSSPGESSFSSQPPQNNDDSAPSSPGESSVSSQPPQNNDDSAPSSSGESSSAIADPYTAEDYAPRYPGDSTPRLEYDLTFTCKPCGHRSAHRISKHGYHVGTVLITCPGCNNRHVISDHLRIFFDVTMTIEDLLRDKGELVKRGNIMGNGDIEFWDDASETKKRPSHKVLGEQLVHNLVTDEYKKQHYFEHREIDHFIEKWGPHPTKEIREKEDKS